TVTKTTGTLSLAGTGAGANTGALHAAGGTGTTSQWIGDITLTGNTTITAADNLLLLGDGTTFADTIDLGSHTLTLHTPSAATVTPVYPPFPTYALDPSNIMINATVTGTGGLTKTGAGTATLIGFPGPGVGYSGDTVVTGGTLIVDGTQPDGIWYGPVVNSSQIYVGNAGGPGAADSVVLRMGQLASP